MRDVTDNTTSSLLCGIDTGSNYSIFLSAGVIALCLRLFHHAIIAPAQVIKVVFLSNLSRQFYAYCFIHFYDVTLNASLLQLLVVY